MSATTTTSCDGCGAKRTEYNGAWVSLHGGHSADLCPRCAALVVASIPDPKGPPSDLAKTRARLAEVEAAYVENGKALVEKTRALEQAERRLKFLEVCERQVEELKTQLSDARDEAEHDVALVHEVLRMLGKKAERRHAARLLEIRASLARHA